MNSRKPMMKPNIINEKSNFVIVTYWWGRGNLNNNTKRPCPQNDEFEQVSNRKKSPITYDKMIDRWEHFCIKNNCNYMAIEYPEFAVKGMYQKAINKKPNFIKDALKACYPRAVVYIDGDMLIRKYPKIFDIKNIDYMAKHYNTDSRHGGDNCYDSYIFETSGGIMYFNNTPKSIDLLNLWIRESKNKMGKSDDKIISLYFNIHKLLLSMSVIFLPHEYLWLSLSYDQELQKNIFEKKNIIIEHPECLTGEEMSKDLGADTSRYPKNYMKLVENHTICNRDKKQCLYEYIFFPDKQYVSTMKPYLTWLNKTKILNVIPYDRRYGEYNKIYESNRRFLETSIIQYKNAKLVYLTHENMDYRNEQVIEKNMVIPMIIKYLLNHTNVIYVPTEIAKQSVTAVLKNSKYNKDFIARNNNTNDKYYKKEYVLKMDRKYPSFYNHTNIVLLHLLYMCESMKNFGTIFNSSPDFLCRIRCMWM